MSGLQIDILAHTEMVEFVCTGSLSFEEAIELGEQIREVMLKKPATDRILVDVSRAQVKIDMMRRFMLGEFIAKNLAHIRIALVAASGDINKMVENTAVNRGASLYATHDREAALSWLGQIT